MQTQIRALLVVLMLGSSSNLSADSLDYAQAATKLEHSFNYIFVPEVRLDPDSRDIEVAYLHMRGNPSGIPTFVFFGGPGESALDYDSIESLRAAHAELLATGDVVFIEQRGVGPSRPNLDCTPIQLPLDSPLTKKAFMASYEQVLNDCIEATGANMAGYTTVEIADDAEDIRKHLGFPLVNVSGGSYGAQQAYYYIQRHSSHVKRAVLSQFLSPRTSIVSPATIDDYILKIGDRVGPAYGFEENGGKNLQALIRSVFEKLESEPVGIQVGTTLVTAGRTDLEIVTALALRRTRESWLLPMLFGQMSEGEFGFIGQIMLQMYRGGLPVNAAVLAFDCAAMGTPQRRALFTTEADSSLSGYGAHLPFPDVCDLFDHGRVADDILNSLDVSGVPTLFIQGELDARARDETLKEADFDSMSVRVLTIQNATHDLGKSVLDTIGDRLQTIEAQFLSEGVWPNDSIIVIPLTLE